MKLQKDMWNGFDFYFYLDRINQSSLRYAPARRIIRIFSPAAKGLSAEGRIILTILLKVRLWWVNPVQLFSLKQESIPFFSNYKVFF